ncbi:MAG: ankyrin repeat domain-containing protein [Burkholderiaceae bacterium]|nr:ankyrin repeat domain-containing protein [Burkholderiaceae bacterium]
MPTLAPLLLRPARPARHATLRGLAAGLTLGSLLGLTVWLLAGHAPARAQPAPAAASAAADRDLPVHEAARAGRRAELEALLRATPALRDLRNSLGATPLHLAALNEDPGPLQALIAAGANPNARDGEGRTPLHMAAFATRTANARLLLRAGADPLLKTDAGRDVLSMARRVRADELAGEVSLWILKGCTPARPC